eukprot:1161340-Pelagomonas_calceolata.AAC.7
MSHKYNLPLQMRSLPLCVELVNVCAVDNSMHKHTSCKFGERKHINLCPYTHTFAFMFSLLYSERRESCLAPSANLPSTPSTPPHAFAPNVLAGGTQT